MPLEYFLDLLRKMFVLLLGSLGHVLHVLLLVEGHFQRATVSVHALQDLPILHACLEKGRI